VGERKSQTQQIGSYFMVSLDERRKKRENTENKITRRFPFVWLKKREKFTFRNKSSKLSHFLFSSKLTESMIPKRHATGRKLSFTNKKNRFRSILTRLAITILENKLPYKQGSYSKKTRQRWSCNGQQSHP